jgi:hypothetical protein
LELSFYWKLAQTIGIPIGIEIFQLELFEPPKEKIIPMENIGPNCIWNYDSTSFCCTIALNKYEL